MLKRLISLNLTFIFMLSLLPVWAVPIHAVNSHDKLIVDGVEYDATQDHGGENWSYYSNSENGDDAVRDLYLTNYIGGPIYCDQNIQVHLNGTNTITSDDGHGIYVKGNLFLSSGVYRSEISSLTVSGAENFEAIYVKRKHTTI